MHPYGISIFLMTIYIGSDHGGYDLKQAVKKHLDEKGIDYTDLGCFSNDPVDYPDVAREVCEKVYENDTFGILICGTGLGMSMAANRRKGIRAAVATNEEMAELARKHNNANVLCLGGRILNEELTVPIVDEFLGTEFEGGRHEGRVTKIDE